MSDREEARHPNAEVVPLRAQPVQPDPAPPERPKVITADITEHRWNRAPDRRPILPPWLRHREQRRSAGKWAAVHVAHIAGFHAVRIPMYLGQHAARSPRGAGRVAHAAWSWAFDREAHELRVDAVQTRDAGKYAALARIRKERVRNRLQVLAVSVIGGLILAGVALAAWPPSRWLLAAAAVLGLGYAGRPGRAPLFAPAVVSARAERLTPDIIVRALGSLSLAGIDRVLREGREITFVSPVVREGPGWRTEIDLPYGSTVSEVVDRREKLASGLRRPLGCVWPDPADEEHAGRLVLYVADEPLRKARQPAYPLARAGKASVFAPVPYGTDQRGRPVAVPLMFGNVLIGSIPRIGKTVAVRNLLLGCALDPIAELRVHELKGTGDLAMLAPLCHAYGSGADDDTIAGAGADLADVAEHELVRRAKVIRQLPRDLCPESKVTPELAARKSLRLHPLVVVIDEAQELFAHPEHGKAAARFAEQVIKRGPALGIILILATQKPDAASLPTAVSSNVSIRFCLRVMDQVSNDMILGTSAYKRGIRATLFTKSDLGCGYLIGAADEAQVTKTYNVDGPAAEKICARARQLREHAGTLTGHAIGDTAAPVKVSLLDDVAAVMAPGEGEIWSETLCTRLAELRPQLYGALTPATLGQALNGQRVQTRQVWARDPGGKGINRRGITRQDLAAGRSSSSRAAGSSGTASGTPGPVASDDGPDGSRASGIAVVALAAHSGGFAGAAAASASGLPALGWLAVLGGLAVLGTLYLISCKIWPYGPCLRCALPHQATARGGSGRRGGSRARRWGTCRRCKGTGRRIRPGARALGAWRGER